MISRVLSAHRDRMRSVDPLLPEPRPLPETVDGATRLTVEDGVGIARRIRVDPDSVAADWGALDQQWFSAQATGPVAMAALLDRWRQHLAGEPDPTPDSQGIVVWPSRDVAMTPVFLAHGLTPSMVIAARLAGRSTAGEPTTVEVRRATPADLDAVVALKMEEVRYMRDLPERPNTGAVVRDLYATALAASGPMVWLAERDGDAIGMVSVNTGDQADRLGPLVAADPVAYVDSAAVAPGQRSTGVAAALIRHVHQALDDAGTAVTLLHYSALNPISAPFWHRSGYRPLLTRWTISPAR